MRNHKLGKAILLAIMLSALPVHAVCRLTGGSLSFGPYDPLSSFGSTTSGTLTVTCTASPPTDVIIRIGPSERSGGFAPRRMRHDGSADTLAYNLYLDPAGSIVWGDGTAGTATRGDRVLPGKPWIVTVYGRMPGRQDVAVGTYSDRISLTVDF